MPLSKLNIMIMKKILLFLFILAAGFSLEAQQDHHYTQFMYNKLLINPAYAGSRGVPTLTAVYRNQWVGFDGAPQSALVSFNSPFLSKRVGVGLNLSHESAGLQRDFFASLAYSYDLIAKEGISLRIGVLGSVRALSTDFSSANPVNPNDPSIDNQRVNELLGNVGAGVYATFVERYYIGFSVPRIYSNTFGFNSDPTVELLAKEYRHFYGMAGGIFPLNEDINLMPAILLKYVQNAPFDADLNVNLDFKKKFTAGISYRLGGDGPGESIDLLAFWQATPEIGVGAAYDFSLSQIKDYTAGSFELLLQADLKKQKKKMSNPRFFM